MILKDISFTTPQENILFDEVLFNLAEEGQSGEVLRFWESQVPFVVLGRIGKVDEDVIVENTKRDNIPVLRRSSGGGTVAQGAGCLNYSFILKKDTHLGIQDLHKSYQYILGKIIAALGQLKVEAVFRPTSDLALKSCNRKFSGNAQRRGRNFILHHGTLLYDFDLQLIEQYLKFPRIVPEYRHGRDHLDFITNLKLSCDQIKRAISEEFFATNAEELSTFERSVLTKILLQKEVRIENI